VLATLTRERAGVDAAQRAFEALIRDTEEPAGNVFSVAAHVGLAMVLRAGGDAAGALAQLSRAPCEAAPSTRSVVQSWIDQAIAFAYLRIGEVRAAREVLGAPPYRPSETLVAALIALADRRPDEATRLAALVERDTPRLRLLATLVDARAAVLCDDSNVAITNARLAMRIAQEHGFLRSVLDYGTALLPEFATACVTPADAEFVSRLRDELARSVRPPDRQPTHDGSGLSGRELDVVRYLATHLSTREIADALHVSRNTVKSHMQHLYRKLGVSSRSAAVERAQALRLLG
jgi:LuxR family maltose regulon positive regulatory protein